MIDKSVQRDHSPPPKRHAVSIVMSPDGIVQAYAERNIDVRFIRVPIAHTRQGEVLAEECARMLAPRRYAELWRADYLRANGSTRPIAAESILDALQVRDILAAYPARKPSKGAA